MTSNRRILIVGHSPGFAGAEYSLFRVCRQIKNKAELHVLAPGGGEFEDRIKQEGLPFTSMAVVPGLRHISDTRSALPTHLIQSASNIDKYSKILKVPDLVYSNTHHVIEGALLAAYWGVPHVWNLREVLRVSPSWKTFISIEGWYAWMQAMTDLFICNSETLKKSLSSGQQSCSKVVRNALDLPHFLSREESRTYFEKEFSIPKNAQIVVSIGNFIPEKDHEFILSELPSFIKEHPSVYFLFIGEKHFRYSIIREKCESMGIGDRVLTPGHIPQASKYLKGSDAYLLMSRTEAYPTVLLEALHAGVPIAARSCGGSDEILTSGGGFCTDHENPVELMNKLSEILNAKVKIPEFKDQVYSEEDMGDQIWSKIESVFNSKSFMESRRQRLSDWLNLAEEMKPTSLLVQRYRELMPHPIWGRFLRRILKLKEG